MTPDPTLALIKETIERTVNGKIDRLQDLVLDHNEKHEADMVIVRAHIEETKPLIEAYRGVNVLGTFAKWGSGIILSVAAVWALFFKN